eukprot:11204944-Lingulodinium_polyedra.AAC.1
MRIMGWGLQHWRHSIFSDVVSPDVIVSLAGNAFSAYAFSPLVLTVIGHFGSAAAAAASKPADDAASEPDDTMSSSSES